MDYDKLRKKLNSAKTFEDFEEVGDEILKLDEIEEDFVKEYITTLAKYSYPYIFGNKAVNG